MSFKKDNYDYLDDDDYLYEQDWEDEVWPEKDEYEDFYPDDYALGEEEKLHDGFCDYCDGSGLDEYDGVCGQCHGSGKHDEA